jgi:hypothetical protein
MSDPQTHHSRDQGDEKVGQEWMGFTPNQDGAKWARSQSQLMI